MQSLERDQLIKIRKAMELLQARPREHLFLAFELFTIYGVLGLKKNLAFPKKTTSKSEMLEQNEGSA